MNTILPPLRMPVITFGACLKGVLGKKGVSASELARMMAYKSRNSIFRILEEEGGHSARQAFFDRLMDENPLGLDEEERADLQQALEISRIGMAAFFGNRAMRELLVDAPKGNAVEKTEIFAGEEDAGRVMETRVEECRELHLVVMGCCSREVFSALRELLDRKKGKGKTKITHFIYTGEDEIIRNVSAIQPLLYKEYYTAYCVEPGVFSPERESLYRTNIVFVRIQDQDGKWYNRQLLMIDRNSFMLFDRHESGSEKHLERLIRADAEKMPLLKKGYCILDANYLEYTQSCMELEQGREIFTIRLDVPISYVNTDILLDCLKDDMETGRLQAWAGMMDMIDELARMHRMREKNFFGKHRMTHTVFSREAMERFARTGTQTDHFFALRPYKPEERVKILSRIREHAEHNPSFNVYFFKEGYEPPKMEIGLYEGMGTLLNKPFTHYDLSGDHTETLITQKEFCECYKNYFVQELLEKWVISQEETLRVLDELIEIAGTSK